MKKSTFALVFLLSSAAHAQTNCGGFLPCTERDAFQLQSKDVLETPFGTYVPGQLGPVDPRLIQEGNSYGVCTNGFGQVTCVIVPRR
jgi:hypothetical protein